MNNPTINLTNLNSKRRTNRKIILLTGASKGLGLALAKKLIQGDEYFLVLTARKASMKRFEGESIFNSEFVWLRSLDVLNYQQTENVIAEVVEKLGNVDILINNAGITDRSTVEDSTDSYRKTQMAVNYLAPFHMIEHVLSLMRKNNYGKIINISSAGGFMAMPTMSSYSASKYALEAASESLWYEMKPWNIHVTLIIPGFIDSEGFENTTESRKCEKSCINQLSTYHEHYIGMKQLISNRMHQSHSTNETIAKQIDRVLKKDNPPLRIYVTLDAWLLFWFRKLMPPKIYHFVIYRFLPRVKRWGKQVYKE